MLTIREIDHLVLRVRDVAKMVRFYGEVLGCPVHRVDEKIQLTQLRAGRGLIDLIPGEPAGEGRNMDHFCLRVDPWDAEAIRAHLRAHGVEPGDVVLRFGAEGQGPSLYLTDPEGNMVELKGPPNAAPQ
jgi:catechol 2,3-dioxygenase-like lactoylglutathione lyase family enzyme